MNFINLLIEHKYNEAKEIIYARLNKTHCSSRYI